MAGAEHYLLRLAQGLRERGVAIGFLCLHERAYTESATDFIQKMEALGVPTHRICVRYLPDPAALKQIGALIKQHAYTVVQSNLLFADLFMACTKWLVYKQFYLISGKHGYEEKYLRRWGFQVKKPVFSPYYWLARFAEQFVDKAFAISKGLQQLYTGLDIVPSGGIEWIPYGFDFDQDYRYVPEYRFGQPQLCVVGRLTTYKGQHYALEALQQLKVRYPQIALVIVGWGETEAALRQQAQDLQIAQQVHFVGKQSRVRDFMHTSDLVLVPSVAEGFGIVILEAMSAQRPVVAFDVPAPNEILSGGAGLLVPPFDTQALAGAIDRILGDPACAARLTAAAGEKLQTQYPSRLMIDRMIQLYRSAPTSGALSPIPS